MLVTTEATALDFQRRKFDKFGDCHIEDATQSSLKFSMSQVEDAPTPSVVEMANFQFDHFSRDYNLGIFCGMVAYVDDRCRYDHKLISLLVKFYGGQCVSDAGSDA